MFDAPTRPSGSNGRSASSDGFLKGPVWIVLDSHRRQKYASKWSQTAVLCSLVGETGMADRRRQLDSSIKPQVASFVDICRPEIAPELLSTSNTERPFLTRIRRKTRASPAARIHGAGRVHQLRPPAAPAGRDPPRLSPNHGDCLNRASSSVPRRPQRMLYSPLASGPLTGGPGLVSHLPGSRRFVPWRRRARSLCAPSVVQGAGNPTLPTYEMPQMRRRMPVQHRIAKGTCARCPGTAKKESCSASS